MSVPVYLEAFIWSEPSHPTKAVFEYRSVHILVPNDQVELEGVVFLQFNFLNEDGESIDFDYIEAYEADNEEGEPCDAYFFLPKLGDAHLPPGFPGSCSVVAVAERGSKDPELANESAVITATLCRKEG